MNMKTIATSAKLAANRGGLILRKHSPEILVSAGIIGLVTSTVIACKQTCKAEELLEELRENLSHIEEASEKANAERYSEEDQRKDRLIVYTKSGVKLVQLYSGPVILGAVSIGMILGGHHILQKRHVALLGAYKSLEEGFKSYRRRVVEEFGDRKDFEYRNGIYAEHVLEEGTDEKGKKTQVEVVNERVDPNHRSVYARFFDESSSNWTKTPENNLLFVRAQQNYANDLLHMRGHVFLNEVYDMLGIQRSQAGALVGWVLSKDSDNFIDFGMYDINSKAAREFVNGLERSILLDFNVDGPIYDRI